MNANEGGEGGRVSRAAKPRRKNSTLPWKRKGLSKLLITFAGVAAFVVSYITRNHRDKVSAMNSFLLITLPLPMLFLVELLFFRTMYAIEEWQHLPTRYENSVFNLIKDVFYFPPLTWMIAIGNLSFHCMKYEKPFSLWYELGLTSVLSSSLGALLLRRSIVPIMQLEQGPLYDSYWIQDSHGLDYGSGMAHSFFHGYLKLIIPKTGTTEKNLEELMRDYEALHGVELVCYKIFILIPKSLHCYTSLMDVSASSSVEESSSLAPKIKTVAGVKDRVYKNSVYKIRRDRDKKLYICAEYATPLKTFKDVVNENGEHSSYYKRHKNEIVLQFYLTLKTILKEHVDCTNFCELIFYDDKEENGEPKDVGKVLLERVKKIEKKARDLRGNKR